MQAALQERYGPPEVVRVADVDRPVPKDDEVLVRVRGRVREPRRPRRARPAAGVRAAVPRRCARRRNHRMGIDVAGVVESVGATSTRFRPGDRVFADLYPHGGGAFAEYACAAEKAFQPMPADMSFEDAATLPHSAILALQGLRRRRGRTIKAGDKVADRRCIGQRRSVRRPDREVHGRRGDRRLQHREGGLRPVARRRPRDRLHDRSTTRRPASATTGSSTPTPTTRSAASVARCAPSGVYVSLGGSTLPILAAMTVGPLIVAAQRQVESGLMLWWKPFHADDVATARRSSSRPARSSRSSIGASR